MWLSFVRNGILGALFEDFESTVESLYIQDARRKVRDFVYVPQHAAPGFPTDNYFVFRLCSASCCFPFKRNAFFRMSSNPYSSALLNNSSLVILPFEHAHCKPDTTICGIRFWIMPGMRVRHPRLWVRDWTQTLPAAEKGKARKSARRHCLVSYVKLALVPEVFHVSHEVSFMRVTTSYPSFAAFFKQFIRMGLFVTNSFAPIAGVRERTRAVLQSPRSCFFVVAHLVARGQEVWRPQKRLRGD